MRALLLKLNRRKALVLFSLSLFASIASFAQPANDNCSGSISRNSNTTCVNSTYTLNNATASAGIPGAPCVVGTHYDVWFRFTATTTSHTITISSLGSNFTNPEVAIFSGTCGALTQIACGTTSVNPTGLTIGTVYYIRVSKVGGVAVLSNGGFNICITHLGTPPTNNECATATSLTSNTSCNNTAYTLVWATAGVAPPGVPCVVGNHNDVWFSFTAVSNTHTATISNRGVGFTNPEVAIFSGPCGTLVQQACGTTTATAVSLTIGATYYVRVSHVGAAMVTANGGFDICVTHPTAPANDNCTGASLLTSTATPTCTNVAGTLYNANNSGLAGACSGVSPTNDVWYRFTATSTTHAVTVSGLGSSLTGANTYVQLFSGTCGTPVNITCQTVATTGGRITSTALTIGTTYYVRVYTTLSPNTGTSANWAFSICVQNPPVNDLCANATVLTPGATCVNTSGTLDLAVPTVLGAPSGCSIGGTYYDVFYRFTAAAVAQTITISGAGSGITAPRITIYAVCGGAPLALGCTSGTSHTQAGLLIGTQYWVGISNYNANPSGTGGVANFNICITNVPVPPGNDNCTGAILLTSGTTCSNTAGTLINATATAGMPACGNALSPDVWYRFVAQSAFPVITLSSVGGTLAAQNPRIQLFSGACGSLTQLTGACVASPLNTISTPGVGGLTIGQTYYVRITTTAMNAPVAGGTYTFNICITDPVPHPITTIDYAKSYVNITSGTVGGTINPGDILEIRATLVIRTATTIDSIGFYDTLKAGGGLALQPNTLATRTNEGKIYQSFTDLNTDNDAGHYRTSGVGTDTTIQMNLGLTATRTGKGALSNTSRPSLFGSTCVTMATYRVIVNGGYGTKINFGGGGFTYRIPGTGGGIKIAFPDDSLMVYQSVGICPNNTSTTNILGDEFNGTFGTPAASAGSQNRGTSTNTSYQYQAFNPSGPGDYFYGVTNNTSANFSTVQTVAKPTAGPRVFSVWDITGDHTGAVDMGNVSRGNRPCNPLQPISATNPCGYMLVVNAAYRTDVAFHFNVSGACTNTYYEISAWVKNICYKCGDDVNGVNSSSGNPAYIPTVPGAPGSADSSGVRPNLAFEIDGVDYYTTGDIPYQGIPGTNTGSDTLNRWVRKSFIYRTAPGQTGFELTIRNNAPGGGGNDWALDDITLRTCYPNMSYSPSVSPTICANSAITIRDTVRSYYNTYVEYKWQRSTNGGATWVDIAGTTATASPTLVGGMYQFVTVYTIPPAWTTMANNGDQYRVVVATTIANLAGNCNYSDVVPVTMDIDNCLDIDDDNDGIPDYVEFNNPVALADGNGNGIPNWKDPLYVPWIDNDVDGVNDYFDWAGDVNNNGVPNFRDPTFLPWVDSNVDGVNDNSDRDLDGLPNQLDRDSDNDGIFDVAESYGVDTNGEGIIDNYTDTDGDGFSQNVDANNTGVQGSGNGLGAQDLDGDGLPNYLDSDSDNDGIPDLVEAGGGDTNNNGKIDISTDIDYDGIGDNYVNGAAILLTGVDVSPVDGRADNWPNKNIDRDLRPNAYDLDADGDGIADVIEAGLPDANLNGLADGALGTNGWSTTVSALVALNLRNTDGITNPDYLDIDSDNDGIPDNIEGMSTSSYALPTLTDADGDGLMLPYDNVPAAYSGAGIFVYDHDADATPDYRDLDTDGDGLADIVEGNDFNLNGMADDNVTLTGLDTDGDGLDNRFDSLNLVTNIKGTSYRMGTGGTFTGDATPGSRTTVQRTQLTQPDRDWRFVGYVLPVEFLKFTGLLQQNKVPLNWTIIAAKEVDHFEIERSLDNTTYNKVGTVNDLVKLNEAQGFEFTDDITGINNEIIYYRLKVIGKAGEIKYSSVLIIRRKDLQTPVTMMPNPANNYVTVNMYVEKNIPATFILIDKVGKKVLVQTENLQRGFNNITLSLDKYNAGVYALIVETATGRTVKQLIIIR